MKKKVIAVSLITSMMLCNSMTVWAADTWSGDSSGTTYTRDESAADSSDTIIDSTKSGQKDVTATFGLGTQADSYSVDEVGEYKITNHTGGWSCADGANNIKVTNKSNVDITASFKTEINTASFLNKYVATENHSTSKLTVANDSFNVDCALTSDSNEQINTVGVVATITRAPDDKVNDVVLGTVTVTIAKKQTS